MGTEAKTKGDVRHLDHFVVAVMDADRAEKFYTEILGARTLKRFDSPNMNRVFMKWGKTMSDCFLRERLSCPSARALLLTHGIPLPFPKMNLNRWRKKSAARVPL